MDKDPGSSTELKLALQTRPWDPVQLLHPQWFNRSEGRIKYLARQVGRGEVVLNIDIGQGNLEAAFMQQKIDFFSLDPSKRGVRLLTKRRY